MFIATTSELLEGYEKKLHIPSDDASKEDLTAMMTFSKLIYSHKSREKLHEEFVSQRRRLDRDLPKERLLANIKMLASDLRRHKFSPEFDEYICGFSMNVKSLADLSVILNNSAKDSWSTIKRWPGETFCSILSSSLAHACFCRLLCYLHMNSCDGNFVLDRSEATQADSIHGHSNKQLVFSSENIWQMTTEEFYLICKHILTLQNIIALMIDCKKTSEKEELMKRKVSEGPTEILLANFYSILF